MATLKNMTRVGADVRQIARLLQAKAPENHMLAYITPEEAQLLRDRGGSGMPDPETGVPSFEVGAVGSGSDYYYGDTGTKDIMMPPESTFVPFSEAPMFNPQRIGIENNKNSYLRPIGEAPLYSALQTSAREQQALDAFRGPPTPEFLPSVDKEAVFGLTGYGQPASLDELAKFDTSRPAQDKNIMARLAESTGMSKEALARLGLAGIQTIIGAQASKKAAEQGQRGRAETQALAAPYQAKGAELQRQAQAGELTPVARQQLQAAQAQAAQAASARGGVGAQQNAARIEALRGQLLQQQYDYGLKLSGIGDQISLGAIKTGLQADQVVNQMTNSYYNNIVRTLMPPPNYVIAGQPTPTQR